MARQGWGEYIAHYDDDSYQHHIPCWVDLDEMEASLPEAGGNRYWSPEDPTDNTEWNDSWEEVEFEGEIYPAVQYWDSDGYDQMMSRYHGNFIVVRGGNNN